MYFNPRSPHGERRAESVTRRRSRNFNPRSPHGERLCLQSAIERDVSISIHAPRTGSDTAFQRGDTGFQHFNPRSPHGERHAPSPDPNNYKQFQSTLPARGATFIVALDILNKIFQSTLPARGATPSQRRLRLSSTISIHAPRTGSDTTVPCRMAV